MWFNPKQTETPALRKIIRSNRNKLEIEVAELIKEIMESVGIDFFSFCLNDLLNLLVASQVKAEKYWVRKIVTEYWKLPPAPNGLTYTTYQVDYTNQCRYSSFKRVGRFYTITKKQLEEL